ncbi:CARDB domain-containing protein [Halopiger goleimassiliensis]|uniref:CARDB domain-containing protein n=1 Tax=Halopiger goleimassiliensis TaxID=1293048 RepID=UPI000677900A|nr:CARDB domain-containing protein [Halopiger goleimassiliensis]
MIRRVGLLAVVALLFASLPLGIGTAAIAASSGPVSGVGDGGSGVVDSSAFLEPSTASVAGRAASNREDILHRTTTLRRLPDEPGTFETEMTFDVPGSMLEFDVRLADGATVESMDGFEPNGDGTYEWTRDTDAPSIRFSMPANRTGQVGHASGADTEGVAATTTGSTAGSERDYTFVDTGEWGIVQVPGVGISVRGTTSIGVDETVTVDGPGAAGNDIAFLGEVTVFERTVGTETIELAVPEAADLEPDPEAILETLAWSSHRLDVGASSEETFFVAAPTTVDWEPRGLQLGKGDAWVRADAPLEAADNAWIHEYVHVHQPYVEGVGTTTEAEWLVEAQADYYAATLTLEKGLIAFDDYREFFERGERSFYADGVLTDPATWDSPNTNYVKGRLVYGELDRQLRLATDGDRTLEDVFRQFNAADERITEETFLGALEQAGGEDLRDLAEEYTRTDATPEMWDRKAHEEAFDLQRATFEYGLAADSLEAGDESWPFLERDGESVTAVPADETVTVAASVVNTGDRNGTADATLTVDGQAVDTASIDLAVDDETVVDLEWTPPEPGEYTLRIGSETVTAFVTTDSWVTVTSVSFDPEQARPGEPITATATVENPGEDPAAAVLHVRTYEGSVGEHPVLLAGGETTTIEQELRFDSTAEYEVGIADATASVTVESPPPPAELEEVPGFSLATALAGLLFAALLLGSRRQ